MNRIIGLDDALLELYPNKKWSISETYDSLIWLEEGITKPTESELVSKQKELQDLMNIKLIILLLLIRFLQ